MAALALSVFGWQSLKQIETSLLPEIEYPEFVIITKYAGGNPEEIEREITARLEEALSSLPSLQDILTSSRDGLSIVMVQFHWDIDHRFILLRIREKIDAVFDSFPEGTQRPYILDFNPGSLPVMDIILSGESGLLTLGDFARDVLKPRFSQIEGIASAVVTGDPEETVQINMNASECVRLGITADQIIQALQDNLPAQSLSSRVRVGYAEYPLTVKFPCRSPRDLLQIPIQNPGHSPVTLADVAQIRVGPTLRHSLVYRNSTPALLIQLFKESGASTVSATRSAIRLINELSKTYPDMKLTVLKNRGEFVEQSIAGLKQSIWVGAGLAFLIILLFLQDFRYAVLLSTVIPVSLLFAFNALYLHGISLNIMTLGGLALGLGLIVDNGIVVIESIFNEVNKESSLSAVIRGVRKVSRAVTGSTLTTIAIFLPIIYVRGYASVLFRQQALTITYTLLISLLAAIFLIPAAYHFFLLRNDRKKDKRTSQRVSILTPVYRRFHSGFTQTAVAYPAVLAWSLNHKKTILGWLLILFVCAAGVSFLLSKQYWPLMPSDRVEIKVTVPALVPFETVKAQTEQTMANLREADAVTDLTTRLIDARDVRAETIQEVLNSPGTYTVYFSLRLSEPRSSDPLDRRAFLKRIVLPYSEVSLYQPLAVRQGIVRQARTNFTVYISGDDLARVRESAAALADYLRSLDHFSDVSADTGKKQLIKTVAFDQQRLSFYGQTPGQLARDLFIRTDRKKIGIWQENLHRLPVVVQWEPGGVQSVESLQNSILRPGKSSLRTEQLFSLETQSKTREIVRVNRKRVAAVTANVPAHRLQWAGRVLDRFQRETDAPGITYTLAGESERIAQSYRNLFMAFGLAVILVYLILAAQFESFIHPFNIILTVPVGVSGALLGLFIFQQSLNVISLIGLVMLIGIGVNDAIIKVDYMNYLRRRKDYSVRDAILETSKEKFRPVLMTTLTTIA
ncbi:MAG: efflux RND transporter permease subunit, partial [Fidelibacterota bacterium]